MRSAREPFVFEQAARIPAPGDNVAIALQTLPAGSRILIRQLVFEFAHTVLEGHRFAVHRIRKGDPLLSWGLPFGLASRDIEPGEYVSNEKILKALAERTIDFQLPKAPNFIDHRLTYRLDPAGFKPGDQVKAAGPAPTFQGFRRHDLRGAGTRNYIVVLGTSSRTAAFARALAARFRGVQSDFPNVDGVVPIDHTEGGTDAEPHNLQLTLRTLAGFVVNPNVAAVLCVDYGTELLSNAALRQYLQEHRYPVDDLLLEFFTINSSFESALQSAESKIRAWLPRANKCIRSPIPLRYLKLGLQCGGSDAFSGISANPLVGILSRETVARGGSANLAETDELIGAETYILRNVRNLETAQAFLSTIDRFQEWASWHGHSAEGNPSGGNMFRGLYNITIKSIGAARKKDPATRLDHVIGFGELMPDPGFYFMNSPGNDLESIAGQVASGCNMILFATGNGSITNFPFVPTIKFMTTTRRFELVKNEMDFNAGRYLDGEPLEELGREAFQQMLRIASGARSAGERAGHFQVQLWREWRQTGKAAPTRQNLPPAPGISTAPSTPPVHEGTSAGIALILPTSLCSGQVACMIADKLNAQFTKPFMRAVALPHTEGCGNSAGESEQLFLRTMAGYLAHPLVTKAVLLEHGCEKTHNDAFRHVLRDLRIDDSRYGFASIQLDGGIERVTQKVLKQFAEIESEQNSAPFSMALVAEEPDTLEIATLAQFRELLGDKNITTICPEGLLNEPATLAYGQKFSDPGRYTMETPTDDLVETITGLAATGAQLIVVFTSNWLVSGNPLVPTIQIANRDRLPRGLHSDVDLLFSMEDQPHDVAARLWLLTSQLRGGQKTPRNMELSNTAFQITRGLTGISL